MFNFIKRLWSKMFYRYYLISFYYEATDDLSTSAPKRSGFGTLIVLINDGLRMSDLEKLTSERATELMGSDTFLFFRMSILSISKIPWFETDVFLDANIKELSDLAEKNKKDLSDSQSVVDSSGIIKNINDRKN